MAVSPQQIKDTYPLPLYNFRVEIGEDTVAFSEISGLAIEYEVATFRESHVADNLAGPRRYVMPALTKDTTVTMKKGVTRIASVQNLYAWIGTVATNQIEKKDVFIRLLDEGGAPVISWKIINAFPVKLEAPGFDAKSNDVALETMELRADGVAIEEA